MILAVRVVRDGDRNGRARDEIGERAQPRTQFIRRRVVRRFEHVARLDIRDPEDGHELFAKSQSALAQDLYIGSVRTWSRRCNREHRQLMTMTSYNEPCQRPVLEPLGFRKEMDFRVTLPRGCSRSVRSPAESAALYVTALSFAKTPSGREPTHRKCQMSS